MALGVLCSTHGPVMHSSALGAINTKTDLTFGSGSNHQSILVNQTIA